MKYEGDEVAFGGFVEGGFVEGDFWVGGDGAGVFPGFAAVI